MGRKQFNKEYKIAAINLVKEEKLRISEAARQLSLSESTLYRWIQEYEEFGDQAFPGKGTAIYHQLYKQKVLERENLAFKEEIELLKKYHAFLIQAKK